jgi:hypothetical protein
MINVIKAWLKGLVRYAYQYENVSVQFLISAYETIYAIKYCDRRIRY